MDDRKRVGNGVDCLAEELAGMAEQLRRLADTVESAASGGEGWAEEEVRKMFEEVEDIVSSLGEVFVDFRSADFFNRVQQSWQRLSRQLTPVRAAGRELLTLFKDALGDRPSFTDASGAGASGLRPSLSDDRAGEILRVCRLLDDDGIADADAVEAAARWGADLIEPYEKFKKATGGDGATAFRIATAFLKRHG